MVRAAAAILAGITVVGVDEGSGKRDGPPQRLIEPCRAGLATVIGQTVDRNRLIARIGAAVLLEPALGMLVRDHAWPTIPPPSMRSR